MEHALYTFDSNWQGNKLLHSLLSVQRKTSGATKDEVVASKRLKDEGIADVYPQTIRVCLRKRGMRAKKIKKPHLTKRYKALRLDFAKKYEHWTHADWGRALFSKKDPSPRKIYGRNKDLPI